MIQLHLETIRLTALSVYFDIFGLLIDKFIGNINIKLFNLILTNEYMYI